MGKDVLAALHALSLDRRLLLLVVLLFLKGQDMIGFFFRRPARVHWVGENVVTKPNRVRSL